MIVRKVDNILEVAPHAGAWIETFTRQEEAPVKPVAPHAGAWIETLGYNIKPLTMESLPMRERGLKQIVACNYKQSCQSLPMRERGLKPNTNIAINYLCGSLPMRERGLKHRTFAGNHQR